MDIRIRKYHISAKSITNNYCAYVASKDRVEQCGLWMACDRGCDLPASPPDKYRLGERISY